MKKFHTKTVLLIILLIGLVFIGVGLTIGFHSFPYSEDNLLVPALAGLPPPPPPEELLQIFGI